MPRLASRVFAQLLADDDGRMTAAQLTEALQVSPAAVSGAVRYLTQVAMIGKERERGSRRDVYVVHTDAWHDAILSRDHILGQLAGGMRSGVDAVPLLLVSGPDGTVRRHFLGEPTAADLWAAVADARSEVEQPDS